MNKNNDLLKAIAISLMALNILLAMFGCFYIKQTTDMIEQNKVLTEQNEMLVNIEYSRCVNDMSKAGDRCRK